MEQYLEYASGFVRNAMDGLKKAKTNDEFALKHYGTSIRLKSAISVLDHAIERLSTVRRKIPKANSLDIVKELNDIMSMLEANYKGDNKHNITDAFEHIGYAIDNLPGKYSSARQKQMKAKSTVLNRAIKMVRK